MYPLERTHPAAEDWDWLPAQLKALRWAVAGSVWTGTLGLAALVAIVSHGVLLAKAGPLLGFGGYLVGRRVGRAVVQARVRRLARGAEDLRRLPAEPDGELLHVRGRVRATQALSGFLHGASGVYRRVAFRLDGVEWVHEAAVDFALVDAAGEAVSVQVAGARLLAQERERFEYPVARFTTPPLPATLERIVAPRRERLRWRTRPVEATELLLRDGDEVEIVGYKTRIVDPTVQMRLERDIPMRAALRSGRALPLLISPLRTESDA